MTYPNVKCRNRYHQLPSPRVHSDHPNALHDAVADRDLQGDALSLISEPTYHPQNGLKCKLPPTRTNCLPYVVNGLRMLQWITIPYKEKTGGSGLWIPVRPQNLPNERSQNDFPIMLTVSLPPDARTGLMVEKSVLRRLGKKSAAQFNAYFNIVLAIQSLWNITKASGEKKVRQDSLFTNLTLSHYKNWKNSD